jgi:CarD family transcriptional regulator
MVKKITQKGKTYKAGDHVIYPSHGVGKLLDIETIKVDGKEFNTLILFFEKEKLTIKIPVAQIDKIGIRHLVSKAKIEEVFETLRGGIKKLKGMWSRRAQEYESKINSGDIMLLAEVLRDLTRDIEDADRSYSERVIYETAIYRLAGEYAVIAGITLEKAQEEIITIAKNKLHEEGEVEEKKKDDDDFDDDFDDEDSEGEEGDEEEEGEEDEDED